MRVLITGMAGFLGTHVAEFFRNKGWDVVGVDNLTAYELEKEGFDPVVVRDHNIGFLKEIGAKLYTFDIRESLSKIGGKLKDVDLIVHTAAQPTMTLSITDPIYDMDENIKGTVNVLEFARKNNIPVANCSSIHVYGNAGNDGLVGAEKRFVSPTREMNETTPLMNGAATPLHASKLAAEYYTKAYHDTYGLETVNFRLTGMYGPRQFGGMNHGWVANFAIRTVMNRPITVFGTDKQVRDILYAQDAARAFYEWYANGRPHGTYNIGGGFDNSISICECLDELAELTGNEQNITFEPARKGDLWYFVCDFAQAKSAFGWEPRVSTKEGLCHLFEWTWENRGIL